MAVLYRRSPSLSDLNHLATLRFSTLEFFRIVLDQCVLANAETQGYVLHAQAGARELKRFLSASVHRLVFESCPSNCTLSDGSGKP